MSRVLIVEDYVDQAESLGKVLEKMGHRVFLAGDGNQAVEQVRVHGCDAAVVDLMMPGQSGRDFLFWFRAQPGCGEVPVVVSTALPRNKTMDLEELPRVKVLQKSYTVEDLLSAFREMWIELEKGVS